ncbi:hypothetical protein [Dictyobacter formicarum]|uniref:Uncharacterized protein n=1 Tax=Dictyobacter formicarum TaxID=2778368 RepID=A0ABQ3VRH6_9CHLR|nr:hypothetical protein [Dictyobacter formicarum]GHO88299.1 hypothetical protein KSZ_63050 [Dictyobacter formicarum]
MRNIALQTYVLLAGAALILVAVIIALTGGTTSNYMTVGGIGAGVVLAYFMTRPRKQS